MNDALNPYASPQLSADSDPAYEQRTIRGTFIVDERTQRDAACGYHLRHVFWLACSLIALPVLMLIPFAVWQPINLEVGIVAVATFFIVGAFVSVAIHVTTDWSIYWHNLRQLRTHPILGAAGPWQIQIDDTTISIATSRGQQTWPLGSVRRMELNRRPIVLWLERDLAIALPQHGDYGEDTYPAVRKTLRQRIPHVGNPRVQ